MAFTKITEEELNSRGATTLPNQPTISAIALKQEFDAPAKEIVAPAVNNLIDELEASTAAASLGMSAPTGRSGNTVQDVIDDVSSDLASVEGALPDIEEKKHTHANKSLLDSYDQTNDNLADAVSKKHEHSNKSLLDSYNQSNSDIADAVSKKHEHSNKSVLDNFSESSGVPLYNGQPVGGGDMYKSDYDPTGDVLTAGGIKAYVDGVADDKVDKVEGKGLSTNDYDDTAKGIVDNVTTNLETKANESTISRVENGATASAKINKGEQFYHSNILYIATSDIASGAAITTSGAGANCVVSDSVTGQIASKYNRSEANLLGPKNLMYLPPTFSTIHDVDFSIDSEGIITFSGTSDNTAANLYIYIDLPNGNYIFSVDTLPIDTSYTYSIEAVNDSTVYSTLAAIGNNNNIPFTVDHVGYTGLRLRVWCKKSTTFATTTLKPMIRLASDNDDTFEPYAETNRELTINKADNSVIAPTENGTTASQAYAVGSHAIRNGAFITWINAKAQGETINDASDYTSGDVADELTPKELSVSLDTDASSVGITLATSQSVKLYGKIATFKIRFTVASDVTITSSKHVIKTGVIPKGNYIPIVSIYNRNAPYNLITDYSGIITSDGDISFNSCTMLAGTYEAVCTYICE